MKICTKMKLTTSDYEEYQRRHDAVYPELEQQFKNAGVTNYTIWYDETSKDLFAYVELADIDVWNEIPNTEICQKWWNFMADIMETNFDNSPVSIELKKVYDYTEK